MGIAPRWTLLIFADFVFSELVLSADKDDGGDESPEDELLAEYALEWNSLVSRDWYLRGLCAGFTISEFKTPMDAYKCPVTNAIYDCGNDEHCNRDGS